MSNHCIMAFSRILSSMLCFDWLGAKPFTWCLDINHLVVVCEWSEEEAEHPVNS